MIFFFISLVTYFCFLILKTRKGLLNLEKTKYNLTKYKKWIFTKENIITLELLSIILIVLSLYQNSKTIEICAIVIYMFLSLIEIKNMKESTKIKKENKQIILITTLIYLLVFSVLTIDYIHNQTGYILKDHTTIYYSIIIVMGYLNYLIILFSAHLSKKKNK